MKKSIILTLIFFCNSFMFAQTFVGKLTYKSVTDDSLWFIESFKKLSYKVETFSFGSTDNIWIKNDSFKRISINNKGEFNRSEYQYGDLAYEIINTQGKIKKLQFKEVQAMMPVTNLKLKEKGKNERIILGYNCKEYIYYYELSNTIRFIKVWIPDKFKSKDFYKKGKFFQSYFYPDGLPFRVESYDDKNTLISSSELINIVEYEVLNDEFEDCGVKEYPKK